MFFPAPPAGARAAPARPDHRPAAGILAKRSQKHQLFPCVIGKRRPRAGRSGGHPQPDTGLKSHDFKQRTQTAELVPERRLGARGLAVVLAHPESRTTSPLLYIRNEVNKKLRIDYMALCGCGALLTRRPRLGLLPIRCRHAHTEITLAAAAICNGHKLAPADGLRHRADGAAARRSGRRQQATVGRHRCGKTLFPAFAGAFPSTRL